MSQSQGSPAVDPAKGQNPNNEPSKPDFDPSRPTIQPGDPAYQQGQDDQAAGGQRPER